MSRAFVKEDDQEEMPFIPPRAPLPKGVTNYVTAIGLQQLHEEKEALEKEKSSLKIENEAEKRIATKVLNEKLRMLQERINSAKVFDPEEVDKEEIRFGATVTLIMAPTKKKQKLQIVGVDEADVKKQKIAFTSPLAKALMGHKAGEEAILKLGKEERKLQIMAVAYA